MINLLPPSEKKLLAQEKYWRMVLILEILFLLFLLSLILILFSIKIFIAGQLEAQKILLEQREKAIPFSQIRDYEKKFIKLNLSLSKLNSFYQNQTSLTEILEKISETLPAGTYLTNLKFNPPQKEKEYFAEVSLSGFCPSREILVEFRKNLEAQEEFKEVYFPPSNWVQSTNIYFSTNFKIKK